MKNIGQMMKQAQALQTKMQEFQDGLDKIEQKASSGGGLVSMVLNGKGNIVSIKIDPSLMKADEAEILEDLIVAAYRDGKDKVETYVSTEMEKMSGGLSGFKLPF
jgi:DNA-binding YbaB/EbfC family protein